MGHSTPAKTVAALALAWAAAVCSSSPVGPDGANCPGTSGSTCYGRNNYVEYDGR